MTRLFLSITALALVITTSANAQGHPPDARRVDIMKGLYAELRTFAQTTILPTLRAWKVKLDGSMSAEDLALLNRLRARATALRNSFVEHGAGMRNAWKGEDYDALRRHREAMKSMKGELQAITMELKPLARKYRPTLEALGVEAKPNIQEWRTEGRVIIETWMATHREELGDRPIPPMMHHGGPLHRMLRGGGKGAAVRFMLWDGGDLPDLQEPPRPDGPSTLMPGDDMQDLD